MKNYLLALLFCITIINNAISNPIQLENFFTTQFKKVFVTEKANAASPVYFNNLYGDANLNIFTKTIYHQGTDAFYAIGRNIDKAILTKINNVGDIVWIKEAVDISSWLDFIISPTDKIILVGQTGFNDINSNCIIATSDLNGNLTAKYYNIGNREHFYKVIYNPNSINQNYPYYCVGSVAVGSNDDIIIANFDDNLNINFYNKINNGDDEFFRDLVLQGSNGDMALIGNLGNEGAVCKISNSTTILQSNLFNTNFRFSTILPYTNPNNTQDNIIGGSRNITNIAQILKLSNSNTVIYNYTIDSMKVIDKIITNNGYLYAVGSGIVYGKSINIILKLIDNGNTLSLIWAKTLNDNGDAYTRASIEAINSTQFIYCDGRKNASDGIGDYDALLSIIREDFVNCMTLNLNLNLQAESSTPAALNLTKTVLTIPNGTTMSFVSTTLNKVTRCGIPCEVNFTQTFDDCGFVNFNATSNLAGPISYCWYFNGVPPCRSIIQNPIHQYNSNGSYTVCVEASNASTSCRICKNILVTKADNTPPQIMCPASFTAEFCNGLPHPSLSGYATATDNLDQNPNISYTDIIITQNQCSLSYIRDWIATDDCGNSIHCQQSIILTDTLSPFIKCPNDVTVECGSPLDTVTLGAPIRHDYCKNKIKLTWSDNTLVNSSCSTKIIRTFYVKDSCLHIDSCKQMITLLDRRGPVLTCPNNITVSCTDINNLTITGEPIYFSDCSIKRNSTYSDNIINNNPCNKIITRTWVVTDACANSTSCIQTITSIDNIKPVLQNCGRKFEVQGVQNANNICEAIIAISSPTVIESCGTYTLSNSFTNTFNASATYPQGSTIITWTATDACGNAAICNDTVIVKACSQPCGEKCCDINSTETFESFPIGPFFNNVQVGWHHKYGTMPYVADNGCYGSLRSISLNAATKTIQPGGIEFSSAGVFGPDVVLKKGINYCIRFCAKTIPVPNSPGRISIFADNVLISTINLTNAWQEYMYMFTPSANYYTLSFRNSSPTPLDYGSTVLIDNVCFQAKTAIYNDVTPPDISCMNNIQLQDIDNDCHVDYIIPYLNVTDNVGVESIVVFVNGVQNSIGNTININIGTTYALMYIAKDFCNNYDTCKFNVSLLCTGCKCDSISMSLHPIKVANDSCCYALDVNNKCKENYFEKIELCLQDPSLMYAFQMSGAGWNLCSTGSAQNICIEHNSGSIPKGIQSNILKFCLDTINNQVRDICWKKISGGESHTVGLDDHGRIWTWGDGLNYKLGNNATISSSVPVLISSANETFIDVSAGLRHTIALKSDGTVWAWGENYWGQCGQPTAHTTYLIESIHTPTLIPGLTGIVKIDAGFLNNLALDNDGQLFSWGHNHSGALGLGIPDVDNYIPTQIGQDQDWVEFSAGWHQCLAVKANGTMWGWGVPTNFMPYSDTPAKIGSASDWSKVSTNNFNHLALKKDGTVYGWGNNEFGEAGQCIRSTTTTALYDPIPFPTLIPNFSNIREIYSGFWHSMALDNSNNVYTWGKNDEYQLGQDPKNQARCIPSIINTWLPSPTEIFGGLYHNFVNVNNTTYAWGKNLYGQLGLSTTAWCDSFSVLPCIHETTGTPPPTPPYTIKAKVLSNPLYSGNTICEKMLQVNCIPDTVSNCITIKRAFAECQEKDNRFKITLEITNTSNPNFSATNLLISNISGNVLNLSPQNITFGTPLNSGQSTTIMSFLVPNTFTPPGTVSFILQLQNAAGTMYCTESESVTIALPQCYRDTIPSHICSCTALSAVTLSTSLFTTNINCNSKKLVTVPCSRSKDSISIEGDLFCSDTCSGKIKYQVKQGTTIIHNGMLNVINPNKHWNIKLPFSSLNSNIAYIVSLKGFCGTDSCLCSFPFQIDTCNKFECAKTYIKNGDFEDGLIVGNLGSGGFINNWTTVTNTPQVGNTQGCTETGSILMWGNQMVGESIKQPTTLIASSNYQLQISAKYFKQINRPIIGQLRILLCPNMPSNYHPSGCQQIFISPLLGTTCNLPYTNINFTSTFSNPWIFISPWNSSNIDHGDSTSYISIDDICIDDATLDTCTCNGIYDIKFGNSEFDFVPQCNSNNVYHISCPKNEKSFNIKAKINCGLNCTKEMHYEIKESNTNIPIASGFASFTAPNIFSLPIQSFTSYVPGVQYNLNLLGFCGKDKCSCNIKFVIDPCCKDSLTFKSIAQNAIHINVNQNNCKATLNFDSVACNIKILNINWRDGAITNGPILPKGMAMHSYSSVNVSYIVLVQVAELDPLDKICNITTLRIPVSLNCKSCCKDYKVFKSLVGLGFTTSVQGCNVTVTAPQFGDCYFFGSVPDFGDNSTVPPGNVSTNGSWSHTYSTSGTYNICTVVYAYENQDPTNICWTKQMCTSVTISCPDTCVCDAFSNLTFRYDKTSKIMAQCSDSIRLTCPPIGCQWFITGALHCLGDCSESSVDYIIKNKVTNQIIASGTVLSKPQFGIYIPDYINQQGGTYVLTLSGKCDQSNCTCNVTFSIPDCDYRCPCIIGDLEYVMLNNFLEIRHNGCQKTFTPLALQACDEVKWAYASSPNNPFAISIGNQILVHQLPMPGLYYILVTVTRYDDNGNLCDEYARTIPISCSGLTNDNPQNCSLSLDENSLTKFDYNILNGAPKQSIKNNAIPRDKSPSSLLMEGNGYAPDYLVYNNPISVPNELNKLQLQYKWNKNVKPLFGTKLKFFLSTNKNFDYSSAINLIPINQITLQDKSLDWTTTDLDLNFPKAVINKNYTKYYLVISLENNYFDEENQNAISMVELKDICITTLETSSPSPIHASIFPNPSTNSYTLQIMNGTEQQIKITVTNSLGEIVQTYNLIDRNILHTFGEEYKAGIYFVKLEINKQNKVFKLIKL